MTELLFRDDAYLKECAASVVSLGENFICVDRTIFYPLGGGQPGDTGRISWDGGRAEIVDTRNGESGEINHLVADGSAMPPAGANVTLAIDWDRRFVHMRMHTAMHLVGSLLQYGVTGGNISAQKSRLDFDTHEAIDKVAVTEQLQKLVAGNTAVTSQWISDAELEAQPELVRTMSVKPPQGAGQIRLLNIEGIDLQPCGGTHVQSTGEIGEVRISKVENKGKHNRRVNIVLDQ